MQACQPNEVGYKPDPERCRNYFVCDGQGPFRQDFCDIGFTFNINWNSSATGLTKADLCVKDDVALDCANPTLTQQVIPVASTTFTPAVTTAAATVAVTIILELD